MSSTLLALPRLAATLAPFVLAATATAQTTYLVGPNGMPNIATALFVAVDGDRIHVEPGSYPGFHCTVGIDIRALQPGTVTIGGGTLTRFELTPAQTVNLTDLDFTASVQIDFGRVNMTGCTITGSSYTCYAHDADLHLVDCRLALDTLSLFYSASLRVDDCRVTAIDCVFAGGSVGLGVAAGNGIACWGSQLHLSNIEAYGVVFGDGIDAVDGSVVWLSDSTAYGVNSCPIRTSPDSVVYVDGVTTIGTGGTGCGTTTPKSLLAVSQPGPLQAGAPFQLDYRGEPNGILLVFAAPSLATHLVPGLLDQPSWLEPSTSFAAGLALLDGSGHATMTWNIPGGPAIPDLSLWFKGISGLSFPLQVAPVAGGIAR